MSQLSFANLETERLTLRLPVLADFDTYRQFMSSPRSIGMGGPFSLRDAWGIFCHDLALWQLFGHGAFMLDLKGSGHCIGQVSINHGPLFPEKELGWFLYDGYEGHGYITEAASAVRDWAFAKLGLPTLVSYFDPNNARSIAVAVRLGATLDLLAPRMDPEDLVYRHIT